MEGGWVDGGWLPMSDVDFLFADDVVAFGQSLERGGVLACTDTHDGVHALWSITVVEDVDIVGGDVAGNGDGCLCLAVVASVGQEEYGGGRKSEADGRNSVDFAHVVVLDRVAVGVVEVEFRIAARDGPVCGVSLEGGVGESDDFATGRCVNLVWNAIAEFGEDRSDGQVVVLDGVDDGNGTSSLVVEHLKSDGEGILAEHGLLVGIEGVVVWNAAQCSVVVEGEGLRHDDVLARRNLGAYAFVVVDPIVVSHES